MSCNAIYRQLEAGTLSPHELTLAQILETYPCLNKVQQEVFLALIQSGGAGAGEVTPTRETVTVAGSTAAGIEAVEFVAISGTVTVAGEPLAVNESVRFQRSAGTLGAIAYDASAGSLRINIIP